MVGQHHGEHLQHGAVLAGAGAGVHVTDCGLTWMVSRWSLLSQMIRDSFTFLISASWSPVKEEGQPPFSYQNLVSITPTYEPITIYTLDDCGSDLSPCLKLWKDLPMMQARVGPTMAPGLGTSLTPADQRSISSGLE